MNDVDNIEFICGDVEETFDELIKKEKVKPDVIIVDPPRRGLDEKTIQNIMKLKTGRVVYISCNAATMVRDLKMMEEMYEWLRFSRWICFHLRAMLNAARF